MAALLMSSADYGCVAKDDANCYVTDTIGSLTSTILKTVCCNLTVASDNRTMCSSGL